MNRYLIALCLFIILCSLFTYLFLLKEKSIYVDYYTVFGNVSNSIISLDDIIPNISRKSIDFTLHPISNQSVKNSYLYAKYYYCAAQQGFANQMYYIIELKVYNDSIGISDDINTNFLDKDKFSRCVDSNTYDKVIANNFSQVDTDISELPTLFINGNNIPVKDFEYQLNRVTNIGSTIDINILYPNDCIQCERSYKKMVQIFEEMGIKVNYQVHSNDSLYNHFTDKYRIALYPSYFIKSSDMDIINNISLKLDNDNYAIYDYNSYYLLNKATSGLIYPIYYKIDLNTKPSIIRFSDYLSPYDVLFEKNTMDALKEEYIDTNKVNYYHYMTPFSGSDDLTRNLYYYSICARYSPKYYEFSKELYNKSYQFLTAISNDKNSNPKDKYNDFLSNQVILSLANEYDLNLDSCINSDYPKNQFLDQINIANSFFVNKVPTFFIKNQIVEGNIDINTIRNIMN